MKKDLLKQSSDQFGSNGNQACNKTTNKRNIPIVPLLIGNFVGIVLGKLLVLLLDVAGIL